MIAMDANVYTSECPVHRCKQCPFRSNIPLQIISLHEYIFLLPLEIYTKKKKRAKITGLSRYLMHIAEAE